MNNCRRIINSKYAEAAQDRTSQKTSLTNTVLNPLSILREAYDQVTAPGGATALVCTLSRKELTCANLGDSGFILIRFDDCYNPFIVMQSTPKQHAFNTPYQLAKLPSEDQIARGLKKKASPGEIANILFHYRNATFCKDSPEDACIYKCRVKSGDLLLLATDGVFDNLFQEEILLIVKGITRDEKEKTAERIASEIAQRAHYKSINNEKTPFSEEAKRNGNLNHRVRLYHEVIGR